MFSNVLDQEHISAVHGVISEELGVQIPKRLFILHVLC